MEGVWIIIVTFFHALYSRTPSFLSEFYSLIVAGGSHRLFLYLVNL